MRIDAQGPNMLTAVNTSKPLLNKDDLEGRRVANR